MDETQREGRKNEEAAERTNYGRFLAIGFVALWLVTLLALVGHVGVGGI